MEPVTVGIRQQLRASSTQGTLSDQLTDPGQRSRKLLGSGQNPKAAPAPTQAPLTANKTRPQLRTPLGMRGAAGIRTRVLTGLNPPSPSSSLTVEVTVGVAAYRSLPTVSSSLPSGLAVFPCGQPRFCCQAARSGPVSPRGVRCTSTTYAARASSELSDLCLPRLASLSNSDGGHGADSASRFHSAPRLSSYDNASPGLGVPLF